MLKNKKKLRRLERKTPGYAARTAQTLVLAGALVGALTLGAAGAANAAWTTGLNWGDQSVSADTTTTAGDSLWRDGKILPDTPNSGNLTITGGTFTIGGAAGDFTTVGNGNVLLQKGTLAVSGGALAINQGDLILSGGTTLSVSGTGALSANNITALGTITSTLSAGTLFADNINYGSNDFHTSGTGVMVGESLTTTGTVKTTGAGSINVWGEAGVTAKNLDLAGTGTFIAQSVSAVGVDSSINTTSTVALGDATFGGKKLSVLSTGAVTAGSLTVGDLVVGAAGADATVTTGQLTASGDVTISGNTNANALSLGAALNTESAEHTAKSVAITMGTLNLKGAAAVGEDPAIGQTLTTTGGITLNAAADGNAVITTNTGGDHAIVGGVTVVKDKYGQIEAVAGSTLNIDRVTASNSTAANVGLKLNNAGTGTLVLGELNLDKVTATLNAGTLQIGHDKMTHANSSALKVNANSTLQLTGGDYNHAMGVQTSGLVMDGGTLRVDGKLTLAANTAGNTQAINTGAASGVDSFDGNIVANTLHTTSSNAQGVTITAGSVQIMGHNVAAGTDVYTTAAGAHSITVTDGNGTLVLGATKAHNLGSEGTYGGKVNAIVLSDPASNLQFGHGNFTVGTLAASANGALSFNDDTGFGGTNSLTLGTAGSAFVAKDVTLGEGAFEVNGTHGLTVDNGTAVISTAANKTGSISKLSLGGTGGESTLTTTGAGTYTIGTLVMGDVDSTVDVSTGKVVTNTLDAGGLAVASGGLQASGTGVWQINNISNGASIVDFTLAGTGTLLIGQNITLGGNVNNTTFQIGGAGTSYDVLGAAGVGTIGSTGIVTIAGNGSNSVVIGAENASATGVRPNVVAQKFIITAADNLGSTAGLTLGGDGSGAAGSLTLTGDGAIFTNAKSIAIGSTDKGGTLALGGNSLSGTGNTGGTYSGEITVGSSAQKGTLNLLGSTNEIKLDKVILATANTAEINLSGTGTLNINSGVDNTHLSAGINLNGANHTLNVGTDAGTVGAPNVTDYTVNGVKVTTGTVTMGAADTHNTLTTGTNGFVLNGTAAGDAKFTVADGVNTLDKLSIAAGTQGTVTLTAGTLNVLSALDLSAGALNLATGTTLAVDGNLTTGSVRYNAVADAAGITNIAAAANGVTLAANGWTVKDLAASGVTGITVNATNSTDTLNLEIGSGGIAASDFNIDKGTVNLLGTGGKISLTDTTNNKLDITGNTSILNVGAAAIDKDTPAVSPNWSAGTVNVNGGNLTVTSGSFTIDKLETVAAQNNNIVVGSNFQDAFNPNGTTGKLFIKDSAFGAVTAGTNVNSLTVNRGFVQFGGDVEPTDLAASMTRNNARAALVVNKAVDLSEVTATFGNMVQVSVRNPANPMSPATDKSIEFGDKSLTYINFDNTGKAADDFAITTGGNVYVDTGASLQVSKTGGLKNGDTVYLLESEAGADSIKGMWAADKINTQSRLMNLSLHTNADRSQILGTTSAANIYQTMPGISGPMAGLLMNMVNTVGVDAHSANAGIRFASRVADRSFLYSDSQAAPTIEGAAQMGAVAGVQISTVGAAQAASGAALTRTSFAQPLMDMTKAVAVHQDADGALSLDNGLSAGGGMKNGLGVWIMPLYQSNRTWGQKSENFKAGMSSDLGGIALGADYTVGDMFRFGAAFNVGGGYAESNGDFNKTDNNFNFWGVNLYGGWTMNNFGLSADVGYTSNYNKVEQEVPASMLMGNLKSDITSSAWTAGLKGEYKFETSVVDIVPHVGVRYMGLTTDSYDVKSGGTVFSVEQDFQSIWTFPIGVAFNKTITTDSGWMFKPQVDLSVIPAAGDVEAKSKSSIPGVPGTAEMKMQVVDYVTFDGGLGLEMGKDNLSFGINYNIQASEHRTGHGVFGTLRYEF